MRYISEIIEFEWDDGNLEKNWIRHKVTTFEAEQVFFNNPLMVINDEKHSHLEQRSAALGKTDEDRLLFIVFTIRNSKIRVISARDMHSKERKLYEKEIK